MRIAVLSMALLGNELATPVSDRVPQLNVEATCKATVATDKATGLDLAQSMDDRSNHHRWLASSAELRTGAKARRLLAEPAATSSCSPAYRW
jgi:hypothetical protein